MIGFLIVVLILTIWIACVIGGLYCCGFFGCCTRKTKQSLEVAKKGTYCCCNCIKYTIYVSISIISITFIVLKLIDITFGYNSIFYGPYRPAAQYIIRNATMAGVKGMRGI